MKNTFLGTGAADWRMAEHREIPGFRRNAAALIDDCLLIDPGPDVPDALETFGKDGGRVRYVLNTHRHKDHYCAKTFSLFRDAAFYPLKAGECVSFGKYTVRALAANHATAKAAVHFLITDGERTLFYGLDGAWLLQAEVMAIKTHGVDLAVLDATLGEATGDERVFEHNDLTMVRALKAALAPFVKRFCISHMARKLHKPHEELARDMAADDIEVAFDGYEIEI